MHTYIHAQYNTRNTCMYMYNYYGIIRINVGTQLCGSKNMLQASIYRHTPATWKHGLGKHGSRIAPSEHPQIAS